MALRVACAKNKLDIVKFLIEKGNADINARDKNGDTCLFYAGNKNFFSSIVLSSLIT